MSFRLGRQAARAGEAALLPTGAALASVATTEHAGAWTKGVLNPPAAAANLTQEHAPDVALGALAGTSAALLGGKVIELLAWVSAPKNAEVRRKRAQIMNGSKIGRGVVFMLSVAGGLGSGWGRGAGSVASGGIGGTGSGLLFTRKR